MGAFPGQNGKMLTQNSLTVTSLGLYVSYLISIGVLSATIFNMVVLTQTVSMFKISSSYTISTDKTLYVVKCAKLRYFIHAYQEHTVIESKPDHFLDDLRLNNPWPELRR